MSCVNQFISDAQSQLIRERYSIILYKIAGPNSGPFSRRPEMSFCQPSNSGCPFSSQGRIVQQRERNGLHISYSLSKINKASDPTAPYSHEATREAFTFTYPAGGVIHVCCMQPFNTTLPSFCSTEIC